jgi:hypothetical protein
MAKIDVNLDTTVSSFVAVAAGKYPMKITKVTDRRPGKTDLEIQLQHVTPAYELNGVDGETVKGQPSGVYLYTSLAPDKQSRLRELVEAAGLVWGDLDTDDLQGKEVLATLKLEEYQGEQKNKVARVAPIGA